MAWYEMHYIISPSVLLICTVDSIDKTFQAMYLRYIDHSFTLVSNKLTDMASQFSDTLTRLYSINVDMANGFSGITTALNNTYNMLAPMVKDTNTIMQNTYLQLNSIGTQLVNINSDTNNLMLNNFAQMKAVGETLVGLSGKTQTILDNTYLQLNGIGTQLVNINSDTNNLMKNNASQLTQIGGVLTDVLAKIPPAADSLPIVTALGNFQTAILAKLDGMSQQVTITNIGDQSCDHQYKETVSRAASCTLPGIKSYKCSVCGYTYSKTIPSLGHDWLCTDHVADAVNPDTQEVTKAGYDVYTCSRCGEVYNDYSRSGAPAKEDDSISGLITRLFTKLGTIAGKLLAAVINSFNRVLSGFDSIVTYFNGYIEQITGFGGAYPTWLSGVWTIIPADLQLALCFVVAVIAIGILGKKLVFVS